MKRIIVYGARWCPDCTLVTQFLTNQHLAYTWKNIEESEKITKEAIEKAGGNEAIPVVVLTDGSVLIVPTIAELNEKLGNPALPQPGILACDVAIIGSGPAGLTAAIYTSREMLSTHVFDKQGIGGQAVVTAAIENYPGFEEPISGVDLMEHMANQATKFGAIIHAGEEVTRLTTEEDGYTTLTTSTLTVRAKAVILTLGTKYKHLNVPGEMEFTGKGVHTCATCDGPFYRGKEVIVIGGGNSALQETLFLTQYAKHVSIVFFDQVFSASQALQQKIKKTGEQITCHFNQQTLSITSQDDFVTGITMRNRETGKETSLSSDGVFIFVGLEPQTSWVPHSITRNKAGFIESDKTLQTNMPGVFVAGDCRAGATMQVASAVGEGASVAMMVRHYLEGKA